MIQRRLILSAFLYLMSLSLSGQPTEPWDLKKCIEYGMANNISVRQADVQARIEALTYRQARLSLYPAANMQNSLGYQFGRSIDPATNQFTTDAILFGNHSLNVNLGLFNWFSKRNTVAATMYQARAASAGVDRARNDIALNIANAYLQILLDAEQTRISEVQVEQSIEQVGIVRIQVKEGALPELNQAELETQLANDSSNLITAQTNYRLSVLQLQGILNIPADSQFVVAIPPVESIPVEPLSELEPAAVYKLAEVNMPQQQINELNLQAAIRNVKAVRGQMYPSLSFFGGLDSRYSNAQNLYATGYTSAVVPIGNVVVNGQTLTVNSIVTQTLPTGFSKNTYFRQLNSNFSQSAGLGLTVPIFNGGAARINWQKAQLNVEGVQLQQDLDALTLKQDIYQAHANAVASLQKFNAAKTGVYSSQKAYDFAKARFDIGLLNSIDLITNQNNLFRAKINLVLAQYDYIFKMKLLEFYRGQGLKF